MYTTEFFNKVDDLAKRNGFQNEYLIIALTNDGVPSCSHVYDKEKEPNEIIVKIVKQIMSYIGKIHEIESKQETEAMINRMYKRGDK